MLGILSFIGGVALVFVGIVLTGSVALGPVPTGDFVFLTGLGILAVGLLYVAVAVGAWLGFAWVPTVGLVTAGLGLLAGVLSLLTTGSVTHGIATLVFPVFLFWYLNRDDVRAAFNEDR